MINITFKRKNTTKKRETSKSIILSVIILTYLFTIFICFMVFKTGDLTPLAYLIPSFFALSTTALGFYSWKSKAENKIKLEIARIEAEEKLKSKYKNDNIKIDGKVDAERNNQYNNYYGQIFGEEEGLG